MKRNIIKWAFASLCTIAAFAACEDPAPAPVEPIFPTAVLNETVAAGESVDVQFTPNLDWEVSISGDGSGNYFWLDDAGMKATKVSGKAQESNVVVTVVFSADEEFDNNRVCDMTLTMGGESKKIATITRPSLGRTFEAYAGVAGEYEFTSEFSTEKLSTASLVSFEGSVEYTLPVRVVTNYAWNIALPEWLKATSADGESISGGAVGTTDFLLTAVLSDDVANGAEAEVRFIDTVNTDAVEECEISLPSVLDRIEYTLTTTFNFNAAGDVMGAGGTYVEGVPAVFELLSATGTTVKVVEWLEEGGYYDIKFADWATVTANLYEDFTEDDVLAKYNVEIAVTENNVSPIRYADVFVIPASKADVAFDDWFDPNTGDLEAEFEEYIIGRISQVGVEKDYITLSDNPDDVYQASLTKYSEQQWWSDKLGTSNIYELVYADKYSDAVLVFDSPFASYKVYDYDFQLVAEADMANFWLKLNPFSSNMKGRVVMKPELFDKADAEFPESFIVLYDEDGKALAGISCRFTELPSVEDNTLTVVSGNAEIVKIGSDNELYEIIYGNYLVSDIYQVTSNSKNLTLNTTLDIWNYFMVNPANWEEMTDSPISMEPSSPSLYFFAGGLTERTEVLFIISGAGNVPTAAIYYIFDPNASVGSAPFSFQYPDMVNGATLAKFSGDASQYTSEFYGLTADNIYELTYTSQNASMAMINVPSMPAFEAAWGNESGSSSYWLTYEQMEGNVIYVDMKESGKTDYFVFKNADETFHALLICTMVIE